MADELRVTKDGTQEINFTDAEKKAIEQQKAQQQLNLSYQAPKVNDSEIQLAKFMLEVTTEIENLNKKVGV